MRWKLSGIVVAAGLLASMSAASAQGLIIDEGGVRVVPPGFERNAPPPAYGQRDRYEEDVDRGIGPREARRIARRAGIAETDDVGRRGQMWIVRGVDERGRGLRVTISARTGEIVNVQRRRG